MWGHGVLFVGWGVAGLLGYLVYRLLVDRGRLLLRIDALMAGGGAAAEVHDAALTWGPPLQPGALAMDFELGDLDGARHAIADWRGRRILMVFFDPDCAFCRKWAASGLGEFVARTGVAGMAALIVSTGEPDENRTVLAGVEHACTILLQEDSEVAHVFHVPGTPAAYVIDEHGRIASRLATGADEIAGLVDGTPPRAPVGQWTADGRAAGRTLGLRPLAETRLIRTGIPAGTTAPAFSLPALHGGVISLSAYRGRRVLLVFSDPECAPCDQLALQLQALHEHDRALEVVMISRGDLEANRAKARELGLTLPIALQDHWSTSQEYGMLGAPVGYLIDDRGVLCSDAARGAGAILALVGRVPAGVRTSPNGTALSSWSGLEV
jgi:peroxiredoxin